MIYYKGVPSFTMPRHDVDPNSKGSDWCLNFSKYIYGQHFTSWWELKQQLFPELKAYADAEQDYRKYKALFLDDHSDTLTDAKFTAAIDEEGNIVNQNVRVAFTHIDFKKIFSPMPAIRNTILGIFSTQNHDCMVDSIDQNSSTEKADIKYSLMAKMLFKDLYEEYEMFTGVDQKTPVPKSMEELALFESIGGFRLPYEIGLEEIIQATNKLSDVDDIKNNIVDDFTVYGCGGCYDDIDRHGQLVTVKYADPNYLILPFFVNSKSDTLPYWGVQEFYTVQQLRQETGWTEDEIYKIAQLYNSDTGIGNKNLNLDSVSKYENEGVCNYNDVRVPVLISEFRTVNKYYKTKVSRKDGNKFSVDEEWKDGKKPKMLNTDTRKTECCDHTCYYTAKWVIGTDKIFGYGRKFDEAFDFNKSEPKTSLHFYVLKGRSITDLLRPMLDQCQQAFLRYQNDIAQAPPANGIAIEVGALADLQFGNKKISPFDTIRIYKQKGIMLYQQRPPAIPGATVDYNNAKPFQEITGGIGTAVKDFVGATEMIYGQIAVLTGIDRFTMNSITPGSETQVTAIRSVIASTKDTLKPIYTGWISIYQRMNTAIALRGHSLCLDNESGYYKIIGKAKYVAIQAAGKTPPAEYGINVIARPSETERMEIKNAAQLATAGGKNGTPAITYSEYMFIVERINMGASLKDIRAYISFKERIRDEKDQAAIEANQKANAEVSASIEQKKAEMEITKDDKKTENLIKIEYYKALFEGMLQNQAAANSLKQMGLQLGYDTGKMMLENQMQNPGIPESPALTTLMPE